MPSHELEPKDDIILHFVLDGVIYALSQNIYDETSRLELQAQLIRWFPEVEIIDFEGAEHLHDKGPGGAAA